MKLENQSLVLKKELEDLVIKYHVEKKFFDKKNKFVLDTSKTGDVKIALALLSCTKINKKIN